MKIQTVIVTAQPTTPVQVTVPGMGTVSASLVAVLDNGQTVSGKDGILAIWGQISAADQAELRAMGIAPATAARTCTACGQTLPAQTVAAPAETASGDTDEVEDACDVIDDATESIGKVHDRVTVNGRTRFGNITVTSQIARAFAKLANGLDALTGDVKAGADEVEMIKDAYGAFLIELASVIDLADENDAVEAVSKAIASCERYAEVMAKVQADAGLTKVLNEAEAEADEDVRESLATVFGIA